MSPLLLALLNPGQNEAQRESGRKSTVGAVARGTLGVNAVALPDAANTKGG